MVYSCIRGLREARNTAEFVAKVMFCHKQGRNTRVGGLRTSWTVPPSIVSLYNMRLLCFVLCRFTFCGVSLNSVTL
jgi:hypothetical protein